MLIRCRCPELIIRGASKVGRAVGANLDGRCLRLKELLFSRRLERVEPLCARSCPWLNASFQTFRASYFRLNRPARCPVSG
jgi:hypothetical protein